MRAPLNKLSISNRRKLSSILLAVATFASLAALTTAAFGRPVVNGVSNAILVGTGTGLFEEFYVQSQRGRWLRSMHPLKSILIYTGVVTIIFVLSIHLVRLVIWDLSGLPVVYRRLPTVLPIVIIYSVIAILLMRVVHFIGLENLFHLMIGTYHRPVVEEKVLMFLDINDSTGLAGRLGAVKTKSFVGKFLFDLSRPITNTGGEIYLYKGDGLIALWEWGEAVSDGKILQAVDNVCTAIDEERDDFLQQFGTVPSFRIGIHGGGVVVSEQGDTKRSIGIYGNTINIAQRMEEAAKAHSAVCVISGDVAKALPNVPDRLIPLGHEKVRGVPTEIPIFEYRVESQQGYLQRRPRPQGMWQRTNESFWYRKTEERADAAAGRDLAERLIAKHGSGVLDHGPSLRRTVRACGTPSTSIHDRYGLHFPELLRWF